ncbi:DUF4145 domain-containing protein [Lysinibacillus fusiformis]|uniref:DUF4145 domain-containing protein n=1 Tax=Lysinibacillus fusiformis TaxID=28031 RepID=UPI00046868D4|nr:DUF4145 domain-containing protein [Lysinibacillus fusiformis]
MKDLNEQVYCSNCKGKRNHKIISTYSEGASVQDDYHWHAEYHIVKCAGCNKIAFVVQYGDEDTWDYIDGEREWVDLFTVYPEEPEEDKRLDIHQVEKKYFKHAPEIINHLYEQIVESYSNKHFILCTSGLRTLIEGICSQLGIKKGYLYDEAGAKLPNKDGVIKKSETLGGRIFELYERGLILFPQALILQKVKGIGNDAIHEIIVPNVKTIKKIIDIIEKVIYDIYELKNHELLSTE